MPRMRQGDEVLTARGTGKPSRLRGATPKAGGPIGDPPVHLPEPIAEIWRELVAITPERVLTAADRPHLEITCRLMAEIRAGQHKLSSYRVLDTLLSRMGLNPQARATVSAAPAPAGANPFDEFLPAVVRDAHERKARLLRTIDERSGRFAAATSEDALAAAGLDAGPEDDGATETEHTGQNPDAYME